MCSTVFRWDDEQNARVKGETESAKGVLRAFVGLPKQFGERDELGI